jgi:hypothetical protein
MASKKNLVVLLIMPFAISILSFTAINMTFNLIDNDILDIDWNYNDNEAFALINDAYAHPLKATAINDRNYPTAQSLVWGVYNADAGDETPHAEIATRGKDSFLHTLSVGNVVITVSNDKGNVQKKMNATIYSGNVIVFNTKVRGSQNNVDSTAYYGEYDFNQQGSKVLSSFEYTLSSQTLNGDSKAVLVASSNNVDVDEEKNLVKFKAHGDAYLTFGFDNPAYTETTSYTFKIVENGVNVYSYDDLMRCTNKSRNKGEIVVMRRNLESYNNTFILDANGKSTGAKKNAQTELFGNYNNGKYSFENDIYQFETKYNQEYIKQWNEFAKNNAGYKPVSNLVNVGIHVTKDFYGNGYTINLHNLTYPSQTMSVIDQDGNTQIVPQLGDSDLFRGPLPYYTLGDPNNMPLVTAYGQDNIGMYVEGDGITINDLVIKNCDFGNNLANLDTVGTVMEVYGQNITVKNSRLSNGKTVFRSFGDKAIENKNIVLDNDMISYSRNFLVSTGNYNFNKVDGSRSYQFVHEDGHRQMRNIDEYLEVRSGEEKSDGDNAIMNYLMGNDTHGYLLESMRSIQAGLDLRKPADRYYGDLTIKDVLFYRSGISSIAFESLFNGPFLYNSIPSMIGEQLAGDRFKIDNSSVIPLLPKEVGGISYPVEVKLFGGTKFYDYKTSNLLDINGLVGENISTVIGSIAPNYKDLISLDKIFPIKNVLMNDGREKGAIYNKDDASNLNIPIAFYGGGLNVSRVTCDASFTYKKHLVNLDEDDSNVDLMDVDFLKNYADMPSSDNMLANIALKAVTIVTGFNPFKFALAKGDGYLYNEAPKVQDLIDNMK